MGLGRYPHEIRAIADELSELLLSDYANVTLNHSWQSISEICEPDLSAAVKFLGQSPSQRARKLRSMSQEDASLLILRARFMGLQAAQASHFADRFEMMPGKGYRDAAVFAAFEVSRHRFNPTYDETVPEALRRRMLGTETLGGRDDDEPVFWTFSED